MNSPLQSETTNTPAPYFKSLSSPSKGFVFVITYARSGDLLLQEILNSISGYRIHGQNGGALQHIAKIWEDAANELHSQGSTNSQNAAMTLAPLGLSLADGFVKNILSPQENDRVLGFREICYVGDEDDLNRQISFARLFFPNAKFVFNIRRRSDVINRGPWAKKNDGLVNRQLKEFENAAFDYVAKDPETFFSLRYGSYVKDVENLEPLFDFLDEPFNLSKMENLLSDKFNRA
ncbi:hypothetical protein PH7735_03266 [Shimia thalassica]|uniref:Sulfotransferase family protein n=1 Tax=Shimia thalassica TaxID=1715693 RepID=A0A0P1IEL3_9RHOB|nr:hypothetical protein [Shimia thalassica]CUK08595.1 hypothetical protein PH7735_03266 [Shimia thalassica]